MKLQTSLLLSMLAANAAIAQSAPPKWEGDIEFGYYQTDGNSNETSVLAKGQATRKDGLWTNQLKANAQNSEVEGVRSEEQYFISDRLSYDVSDYNYTVTPRSIKTASAVISTRPPYLAVTAVAC